MPETDPVCVCGHPRWTHYPDTSVPPVPGRCDVGGCGCDRYIDRDGAP